MKGSIYGPKWTFDVLSFYFVCQLLGPAIQFGVGSLVGRNFDELGALGPQHVALPVRQDARRRGFGNPIQACLEHFGPGREDTVVGK